MEGRTELGKEDKRATLTFGGERSELKLQGATTILLVEGMESGRGQGTQDVRIVFEMVRGVNKFESEGDVLELRGESALVVRDRDGEGEGSVQKRKLRNFGKFQK